MKGTGGWSQLSSAAVCCATRESIEAISISLLFELKLAARDVLLQDTCTDPILHLQNILGIGPLGSFASSTDEAKSP